MTWGALAFFLVAIVGSAAFLGLRAWRAWRTFRAFTSHTTDAIGIVTRSAAEAEQHATQLTHNSARLTVGIAHLQRSLEELAVLRAATAEPRALLAGLRGIIPTK